MPGTPGYGVSQPMDEKKISMAEQSLHRDATIFSQALKTRHCNLYQSGIGILLYLVKRSRPDIANAVCKCTKVLDGATTYAYHEMLHIIKYLLDTKDYGLRIVPTYKKNKPWDLVCCSDSDYEIVIQDELYWDTFCIVPISWRSKDQRSIALSSSEAEWVALCEAVKEVMFVSQLLTSMKIHVQCPIIVLVQNVGEIFMAQNVTTTI
ncbi:LOW QUALITY PROTEIN: hypothetical protein ACHAXS_000892 [Conticribra weissflogii]